MSRDMIGFCVIVALLAAAWHFVPVVVAIVAFLVLLGLVVLSFAELLDWLTGEDEERR